MPRVVSFFVLLAIILLTGSMFFQVMVQFLVPLFLAAVMVVIFKPMHRWILERCGKRPRIAAALTSLAIVLIVLLPTCGMLIRAVSEGANLYNTFIVSSEEHSVAKEPSAEADSQLPPNTEQTATGDANSAIHDVVDQILASTNPLLEKLHLPIFDGKDIHPYVDENLKKVAAPLALGGVRVLASTLIGLAIMVLTMYYFFSDGPSMVAGLMKLSPLDDQYEQELLDKFGDISRAVVVATLLSAVVQGLLAGAGYLVVGAEYVFFLTALTVFLAMVPFIGAAAVWVPVCLYLLFYNGNPEFPDGRPVAALGLAIYCVTVVSMIDNFIKPIVLHGQANLHPLLALLSVIGGVQALGPIGILVGPMLVAFLQALLNMLNKELHLLGQEADEHGTPVVFATATPGDAPTPTPQSAADHKQGKDKNAPSSRKRRKGKK